jgi:hypothetical protein
MWCPAVRRRTTVSPTRFVELLVTPCAATAAPIRFYVPFNNAIPVIGHGFRLVERAKRSCGSSRSKTVTLCVDVAATFNDSPNTFGRTSTARQQGIQMTKMNWDRVKREDRERAAAAAPPDRPRNPKPPMPPKINTAERLEAERFVQAYAGDSKFLLSVQERLRKPIRSLSPKEFDIVKTIRREEAGRVKVGSQATALKSNRHRKAPSPSKPPVGRGAPCARRSSAGRCHNSCEKIRVK